MIVTLCCLMFFFDAVDLTLLERDRESLVIITLGIIGCFLDDVSLFFFDEDVVFFELVVRFRLFLRSFSDCLVLMSMFIDPPKGLF